MEEEYSIYIIIYMITYIFENVLILGDGNGTYIAQNHRLYTPAGGRKKSAPGWERWLECSSVIELLYNPGRNTKHAPH